MKPKKFDEANVEFAKDQPEYEVLPAWRDKERNEVISCWTISDEELEIIKKEKVLWLRQLTFDKPLQPILLQAEYPFERPAFLIKANHQIP